MGVSTVWTKEVRQLGRCITHPCRDESLRGPIFLCYRRSDSLIATMFLSTLLKRRFGDDEVFHDLEDILPGVNYRHAIREFLESCSAVLVVIGPTWLETQDPVTGKRRIDNPNDDVRREIEMALDLFPNVRVIPILVDGATMPAARQLPRSIRQFAYRNAHELSGRSFATEAHKLMDRLESAPAKTFGPWADIKLFAPTWALLANAALRPLWSNVLLPLVLLIVGLTVRGAWWLVPVAFVLWVALGTVSLLDKQQARCVRRCLHGPTYADEHAE